MTHVLRASELVVLELGGRRVTNARKDMNWKKFARVLKQYMIFATEIKSIYE